MLDRSGQNRGRYEDVLRAVGHYLDAEGLGQVTLVETPEGFVVIAYQAARQQAAERTETILISNEDVDAFIEEAYRRRARPANATMQSAASAPERSGTTAPPSDAASSLSRLFEPGAETVEPLPGDDQRAASQPAHRPPSRRGWLQGR